METVRTFLPLLQASLLFAKPRTRILALLEQSSGSRARSNKSKEGSQKSERAQLQGCDSGWESHPHPQGSTGRREASRKPTEEEAGSKGSPPIFQRTQKSNRKEKKGFSLPLHRVFSLPLKMTLEKERQG